MKRTPLRRVSVKRAAQLKEYSALRKAYLSEHPTCEMCNMAQATDIHHAKGRFGSRLNDTTHWCALCRPCHSFLHNNPKQAYEKGYLLNK